MPGFCLRWSFDLDGVGMPQLRDTLHQMRTRDIIPRATFVVNSGTGLHLCLCAYTSRSMYPQNQKVFEGTEIRSPRRIWNRFTQGSRRWWAFCGGFSVVGTSSKLGKDYPVVAYRCGGCGGAGNAGLYPGQQWGTAAHTGAHAKEPPVAGRGQRESTRTGMSAGW